MVTTLGVVEVRRIAGLSTPTACRRLGGKSLLEWVVRRLSDSLRLDRVIVLCPQVPAAQMFADMVPRDVPLLVVDKPDSLARLTAVLEQHPAEAMICVAAEHPFVDPELIDRLIATAANHPEADYIGFCSRSGRPAMASPLGMIGEWIRATAIQQANAEARDPTQRNHVGGFLHAHPERFQLRLTPVPPELDRDDLRLIISGDEDWEHVQAISRSTRARVARLSAHCRTARSSTRAA